MSSTQPVSHPIYDNCVILAPDGEFLAYCQRKRINWYLERDLADKIDENTIQLKFEPKGREGAEELYNRILKQNRCVVCGTTEKLNRHHVVPYCFIKHLPEPFRLNNSHDILALCIECHATYEGYSYQKKLELESHYNVPLRIDFRDGEKIKQHKLQGWAKVILYGKDVPDNRKNQLLENIKEITGKYPNSDELKIYVELQPEKIKNKVKSFGERVVESLEDYNSFAIEWRIHFIETMKPKYLDAAWKVDRIISYENSEYDKCNSPYRSFTVFCERLFAKLRRNFRLLFIRG